METPEVLALKRAVVSGGCSPAHSCDHCAGLHLPLIPKLISLSTSKNQKRTSNDGGRSGPFWYSRTHAQRCAYSGCAWWLFIHKQIRRHELVCEAKNKWRGLVAARTCSDQDQPEDDEIKELESVFLSYDEAELLKDYLDDRAYQELLQLVRAENLFDSTVSSSNTEMLTGDVDLIRLDYSITQRTSAHLVLKVDLTLIANGDSDRTEGARRSFAAIFEVLAQPGDLGGSVGTAIPVNVDPGCPSSFELMRHWIRSCESHNCGFAELPRTMPSMLLDVQEQALEKRVRLIEVPDSMKERFVALSYCWGAQGQQVMNIKETRRALSTGIYINKLDLSIQNAIEVTMELGLRYIWIDALCIPQDDPVAKGKEIASMAEIYGSSTFTIYASRAQTVKNGFLSKREPAAWGQEIEYGQQVVFQSRIGTGDHRSYEADIILIPQLGYGDDKQNEPLQERAWTLQELILPPRRLSFGTRKTTWTCLRNGNDQLRDGWTESSVTLEKLDDTVHANASHIVQSRSAMSHDHILDNWYELVGLYNRRQISFESDRLPAISALARAYCRKLHDEYICGHWKSTLPIELVSFSRIWRQPKGPGPILEPTWSWVSYKGQISWKKGAEFVADDRFRVIDFHVDYKISNDVFGAIDRATIRVRGLLYHASPEIMHRDPTNGGPHREVAKFVDECPAHELQSLSQILNLSHSYISYDYKEEELNQDDAYPNFYESLHLLLIAYELERGYKVELPSPRRSPQGLVLYHHNGNTFSRVGMFVLCRHGIKNKDRKELKSVFPSTEQAYNKRILEMWHGQVQEITIM